MKRQEFVEKLAAEHRIFGFKNLIYIDESGFDDHCHRDMGLGIKTRLVRGKCKRRTRTHLIMAQRHGLRSGKKEWLAPILFEGSCTTALVETGIEQCLMKELYEPTIIVMDNASFHNYKRIQDIIAPAYHDLSPLPPYSPDVNPIEKTFGAMKKRRQSLSEGSTIDQLVIS
ncbi:transposase [Nitrosococcus watsonii]|uniref:Tc1-like transposase DDE domain-containing protein n=1 Tax=Nitrosococcus watsoni (strain C-113) TaxID=105559 RepID=D8K807_NITWC|nr:transposase [Nitrosococcus watsonii]ADJ27002.1 hypothetical protein Nwat_0003 [Nitrosococcus watsonii C-113]